MEHLPGFASKMSWIVLDKYATSRGNSNMAPSEETRITTGSSIFALGCDCTKRSRNVRRGFSLPVLSFLGLGSRVDLLEVREH